MNPLRRISGVLLALSVPLSIACSEPSGGGAFSGTWRKEYKEGARSDVSIWQEAGTYRFAVNRYDASGLHILRCGRTGDCAYFEGEAPFYTLAFEVRDDSNEETLYVEVHGGPIPGRSGTPIEWVDRVTLGDRGESIDVQRVELNGQAIQNTPRRFHKRSNAPFK